MVATRQRRARRKHRPSKGRGPDQGPTSASRGVLWLPLVMTGGLVLLSFVQRVQNNPVLIWSFWGSAALLVVWQGSLFRRSKALGLAVRTELRPQHYIQALVHLSVYAYWGWYWRPVYDFAWLLTAQLVFAYAFDMLLCWSRRHTYVLGFGPFPIIFSTNLFLWFRDDWFYLQFFMIAVGFLGKEFVRWHRDGRSTHIFNPSAFSLGLFSLVLIATNSSNLTWGDQIATTLNLAPNPYLFLFLVGLIVMYFFSITLVSACAAAALFGLSALYTSLTGVPFFHDSEIPIAVFLGLHLLVTDPSTSPKTTTGKAMFGLLYGLCVFGLYELLGSFGLPTFYDKLLGVPLLNLCVPAIDQAARGLRRADQAQPSGLDAIPRRANLAVMAVWVLFFGAMAARSGATDGKHTGDSVPFWQEACALDQRNACRTLALVEVVYCTDGSGWACNEIGLHYTQGFDVLEPDPEYAAAWFSRACELGFQPGCANQRSPEELHRDNPRISDLRFLLREGRQNLREMPAETLRARACDHGWTFACGDGTTP